MIAVAALIVACFAITGFISIPKDHIIGKDISTDTTITALLNTGMITRKSYYTRISNLPLVAVAATNSLGTATLNIPIGQFFQL